MSKQSNAKAAQSGPIIKFKTDYRNQIERVEVLRETDSSVFFSSITRGGERREAKVGSYCQYHDSWAAAHAYLMEKAGDEVTSARLTLERANGKLGNIKGMKPPKN